MTEFRGTTSIHQQGSRTLPREYYTSEAILAEERERIFARGWNCAGRVTDVKQAGDFLVREIAGESIIVTRDKSGTPRAFFNICRHRGTRICREASGHFPDSIQCSYHAWTYALDGRLVGAPHMQEAADFGQLIRELHQAWNVAVLLVEHHMRLVMGLCDRIVVLDHGEKIAEGVPSAIRADRRVIEAYLGAEETG